MHWIKPRHLDQVMIMFDRKSLFIFLLLVFSNALLANQPFPSECRPIQIDEGTYPGPNKFSRGLLWKIKKHGVDPSHIFGTIHVSNEEILSRFGGIETILAESDVFIMEALPDPEQMFLLRQMMFFSDGKKLDELISPRIFSRTVEVLTAHHLDEQVVSIMKPWAAYLTMSYPADMGAILDLLLLQKAQQAGIEVGGLETLKEQGDLFNHFSIDDQSQLLTDTVCHYSLIEAGFEKMLSLYMERDLAGLYTYGLRYSFADNSLYEELTDKILTKRNYTMVERMRPVLEKGAAFIAVGALHLPGIEGVLALLERQDYEITRVY